jgi:hypothetical protein
VAETGVVSGFSRTSPVEPALARAPFLWALGYVVLFAIAFSTIAWSLGDTYSHLARPALASWTQAVKDAFTSGREYRPLFDLAIKASYETAGTWLPFYQALVMLLFAALLLLVVWLCRPIGPRRALAACIAISCVSALHTARILFGFWPLNHYAFVMVLVLIVIALALRPVPRGTDLVRSVGGDWLFGLLALVAMLGLELGALIVPLSIVLWWFGAPGIGRRGVLSVAAGAVVYLVIRLTLAEYSGESLYADTGFLFQTVDAASLRARFGDSPWLLWIYNAGSTFLTIVASEPREGVFSFVESLLAHDMESWRWFHVGLSALTTVVIAGGLIRGWPWQERDRLLVVAGCALLVFGSALGFLYTRDRIGLAGGIGYALLLYVACASWLGCSATPEGAPSGNSAGDRWRRTTVTAVIAIVAAGWAIRSGETFFQLRDLAWDYRTEWTERFEELGARQEQTALLHQLRAAALAKTPADPRDDPAWTYFLFERRFRRSPDGAP